MYTSPLAMMQQFGVQRLTKYASPIDTVVIKVVPAAVLRAIITGGDTSSFSNEQLELGRGALTRLEENIKGVKIIILKKNHRHEIVEQILKTYEEFRD